MKHKPNTYTPPHVPDQQEILDKVPAGQFLLVPSSSFGSDPFVATVLPKGLFAKSLDSVMFVSQSSDQTTTLAVVAFARRDDNVHKGSDDNDRDLTPFTLAYMRGKYVGALSFHPTNNDSPDRTVTILGGKAKTNDEMAEVLQSSGHMPTSPTGSFGDLPDGHQHLFELLFEETRQTFKLSGQ